MVSALWRYHGRFGWVNARGTAMTTTRSVTYSTKPNTTGGERWSAAFPEGSVRSLALS
jgi:hypothetical protein